MGRISTSPRRATDEHLLDVAALEMRFQTDLTYGLTSSQVTDAQSLSTYRPNLLPTDVETGHGAIHELVAVLREGIWIHTRAENLVPGDVISLKAGQCVPADVRLVEADEMVVTHATLTGEKTPLVRSAITVSVFDSPGVNLPYMQAANMLFYGTTITVGTGKGVVCRTGADTVLGVISNTVLQSQRVRDPAQSVKLLDDIRSLGVACKDDQVPACLTKLSALVVEHDARAITRTVATVSFGTNLPAVVTALDAGLRPAEATADDVERAIAATILETYHANADANALMRAFSACHSHPSLSSRDQSAIARFCDLFTGTDRYAASLCGQVSGCDVYVHFDPDAGAHVVVLQGPAREVLSRCGQVRKPARGVVALDTADLQNVEHMLETLEARGEEVVGVAELYLDDTPTTATVFDMRDFNFPTSNLVYLGALGLVDKPAPELVNLAAHCRVADVSLYVMSEETEFEDAQGGPPPSSPPASRRNSLVGCTPVASPRASLTRGHTDSIEAEDGSVAGTLPSSPLSVPSPQSPPPAPRFQSLCLVKMSVRDPHTDTTVDVVPNVVSHHAISISNTYAEWKTLLEDHPCVVFEGAAPSQIDLLVETLQDLGETVGLVASGNANALSLLNADVGFAIPTGNVIDLSEDAADIVLGYSESPRVDAVRIVEMAKRVPQTTAGEGHGTASSGHDHLPVDETHGEAKHLIENLLRDTIAIGRALHLTPEELQECFHVALGNMVDGSHEYV
ncbi:Aste57867_14353 [Aphanomyces stellatus]|uniref:Aste57867_14353 protein n=1 Tax=Aphanomyces stellatus TaxID=120398 RepID=A0A485L2W1_9STRA|nr:hypothetical protein As57867_014299 [Aphanomyces stellatus]VFT91177.1 Aste57867_14353 [Aphanomyces stellatus]